MSTIKQDVEREDRIENEVIVDAMDSEERAMGWYYYLDDKMQFPFAARCSKAVPKSPLREGEQVRVLGLAPEDECIHGIFAEIEWQGRTFCVPLEQLLPLDAEDATQEAAADWHYWKACGYEF